MPDPSSPSSPVTTRVLALIGLAVVVGLVAFAAVGLLVNIFERKQEARTPFFRVVDIDDRTVDPEVWGRNFPLQYDSYRKTVDMQRTAHGGSEAIPQDPSPDDPRTVVAQQKLDRIPHLRRMWAGYGFSKDFREERGHAYMLEDQMFTGRQSVPQPGTCLQCHASVYVPMMELGDGDLEAGFAALNQMSYQDAVQHVEHPVSCIDCHDADTMRLRVTRPGFIEGIRRVKAREGVENFDVNADATRREMRTFVCAQCHVEYYFAGDEKRLTFPWHEGVRVQDMLAYYDRIGFKDWTHAETGAPMLKAQHPEYEMWSQGTHARAGVSCADCHMPYERVGAMKVSDHHVRSPLLNVANACQTCHNVAEDELLARAERIQERHATLVHSALNALVDLIDDIKSAREAGLDDAALAEALQHQRAASFYVDYVEAENSTGFHADQEAARILGESIDFSRRGQIAVRDALAARRVANASP